MDPNKKTTAEQETKAVEPQLGEGDIVRESIPSFEPDAMSEDAYDQEEEVFEEEENEEDDSAEEW
jgi:hypothetical protein